MHYQAKNLTLKPLEVKNNTVYQIFEFDDGTIFKRQLHFQENLGELDELDNHLLVNAAIIYLLQISQCKHPEKIIIQGSSFSEKQIKFWKDFYLKVASQFFFLNQIPFKYAAEIVFENVASENKYLNSWKVEKNKAILGIGGGKESLTSFGLLKKTNLDLSLLRVPEKDLKVGKDMVDKLTVGHLKEELDPNAKIHTIYRQPHLDIKKFFNYDKPTFGPEVARVLFLMLFLSKRNGYQDFIVGTERSSNFRNTFWDGHTINHQYGKTSEFLHEFNHYVNTFFNDKIRYYSSLEHIFEYKIMKYFAKLEEWNHQKCLSCNVILGLGGSTNKVWCGKCPKCAFTYVLYRSVFTKEKTDKIFKTEMFQNLELFLPLMDIEENVKPFECVGEKKEVWLALEDALSIDDTTNEPVLNFYKEKVRPTIEKDLPQIKKEMETNYQTHIPPDIFEEMFGYKPVK